jgi:hypothetical protein
MAHLPDPKLHKWETGQQISSAVLNHDFGALHMLAEYAADLALEPDPNAAEALARVTNAESRIAALERYNANTARERGEQQFTPLATFGALVQQVSALADPLHEAAGLLSLEAATRRAAEESLSHRLALLEAKPPAPPAPSVAEFEQLRAELAAFCASVEAAARNNRTRFVPLPALAALLKRMDAFTASTAADDVKAMRDEVARLHRLIADTDRRAMLHRMYTPRAAFAYLLRRVERLEGRKT